MSPTTRRLVTVLVVTIALFMVATVAVAIWQEDLGWGTWWAVPLGGGFIAAIVGFRILVQLSQEAADKADSRG